MLKFKPEKDFLLLILELKLFFQLLSILSIAQWQHLHKNQCNFAVCYKVSWITLGNLSLLAANVEKGEERNEAVMHFATEELKIDFVCIRSREFTQFIYTCSTDYEIPICREKINTNRQSIVKHWERTVKWMATNARHEVKLMLHDDLQIARFWPTWKNCLMICWEVKRVCLPLKRRIWKVKL